MEDVDDDDDDDEEEAEEEDDSWLICHGGSWCLMTHGSEK